MTRLARKLYEPPSVRAPERRIPRELEAVCAKSMSHRPEDRYASASSPPSSRAGWPGPAVALAVAILLLALGARREAVRRADFARRPAEEAAKEAERVLGESIDALAEGRIASRPYLPTMRSGESSLPRVRLTAFEAAVRRLSGVDPERDAAVAAFRDLDRALPGLEGALARAAQAGASDLAAAPGSPDAERARRRLALEDG